MMGQYIFFNIGCFGVDEIYHTHQTHMCNVVSKILLYILEEEGTKHQLIGKVNGVGS